MNVRACLFDLDGVLVDTARFHYLAWKNLADKLGINFTLEDNERLKGVSRMDSLEILLDLGKITVSTEEKNRYAAEKNELYLAYVRQMTPDDILPGVKEFLRELKANGIRVGLGSASKNAMTILDRLQVTQLFDTIIDGNKVTKAKPDPEIFLKGAEELTISPANCVVFEDAEAGVEAAIAANMKCVGIGNPQNLGKANLVIPGFKEFSFSKMNELLK